MDTQDKILSLIPVEAQILTKNINGFTINYVKAGQGPPLLLLHGANVGWIGWYNIIAPLSKKFTVYALDWPGSGYSTKIDFSSLNIRKHFLTTLIQFISNEKLQNIRIIAHSVSGIAALQYAHAHPKNVHKLLLVGSMGFTDYIPPRFLPITIPWLARLIAHTVMKPTKGTMEAFLQSVFKKHIALPDAFVEHYYHSVIRDQVTHPIMLIQNLTRGFRIKKELLCIDLLSSINCPVLVIHGSEDPLIPIDKIHQSAHLLPNGTLSSMDGVGHVPSLEAPNTFLKLALQFL